MGFTIRRQYFGKGDCALDLQCYCMPHSSAEIKRMRATTTFKKDERSTTGCEKVKKSDIWNMWEVARRIALYGSELLRMFWVWSNLKLPLANLIFRTKNCTVATCKGKYCCFCHGRCLRHFSL